MVKRSSKRKKTSKRPGNRGAKNVVKRLKSSDGIVPFDEHTPEEQKDLIERGKGLVKSLGLPSFEELMEMSTNGRPKYFETPDLMYSRACEYFQWSKDNPWYKYEYKDHEIRAIEVGRPFTIDGLCMYLRTFPEYFNNFESQLKKTDPEYGGFTKVIRFIRHTVRNQKFEGAAIGAFNANLISYDLGIRKDMPSGGVGGQGLNIIVERPDWEQLLEETKAMLQALDEETPMNELGSPAVVRM